MPHPFPPRTGGVTPVGRMADEGAKRFPEAESVRSAAGAWFLVNSDVGEVDRGLACQGQTPVQQKKLCKQFNRDGRIPCVLHNTRLMTDVCVIA